jgi:hypothetical protein
MPSHMVLRNSVYHYNRHVPEDVQPFERRRWWKESLKTGDKREAETRAREIAVRHDRLIAEIRSKPERQRLEELEKAALELRSKIRDEVFKRLDAGDEAVKRGGIQALKFGNPERVKFAAVKRETSRTIKKLRQHHSLISDYALPAARDNRIASLVAAQSRLVVAAAATPF